MVVRMRWWRGAERCAPLDWLLDVMAQPGREAPRAWSGAVHLPRPRASHTLTRDTLGAETPPRP